MRVTANSRPYDVADGVSVTEFIRLRGLDPRYVVVERNSQALDRGRYDQTVLADGDRLELVRAVAGG